MDWNTYQCSVWWQCHTYDDLFSDTAVFLDVEDVAQSAGAECQVQSCDHIFGFNNANNFADLAAHIDNVKLNSVLDHYGVLIACDKLVGNLVKGNGLCALMDSHVHPPMNAGTVNLTSNSSQHLIQEYASMLLAEGHTLNIVTLNWVEHMPSRN